MGKCISNICSIGLLKQLALFFNENCITKIMKSLKKNSILYNIWWYNNSPVVSYYRLGTKKESNTFSSVNQFIDIFMYTNLTYKSCFFV